MSHKNHVAPMEQEKAKKFDDFYKTLGTQVIPEDKRIDYVLVYPAEDESEMDDAEDKEELERKNKLRDRYELAMKDEGLMKQRILIEDHVYTKIHCPFKRLCEEAEKVTLEMPLLGCESENVPESGKINSWIRKTFWTDNEVDLVSAPFKMDRMHLYENYEDPTNFFRPSIRSLLVEHILINIDLRTKGVPNDLKNSGAESKGLEDVLKRSPEKGVGNCWGCLKDDDGLTDMQKVGLDFMVLEGVYTNRFTLHEESKYDPDEKERNKTLPTDAQTLRDDPRFDMQLTWTRFFKFQPLWKIRNYFGEKIAFYFAWSGTLITTLWLPMIFGFICFIYGIVQSADTSDNETSSSNSTIGDLFKNVKESFDNDSTPYFALFLCIWGTVFLEIWKRKQADLAYKWDVEQFEENEPDRPEFYGTKQRIDPVTNEEDWYYPFARRAWKLFISSMSLLFMVALVCISVMAVIVYRVIVSVDYCPGKTTSNCMFVATIISSVLNAVSILILGVLYNFMAKKLTEWENHRTQTKFNDALIIKLFGFQFVNNYASCFYIAFFRGRFGEEGVLGKGEEYADMCDGTCMSQLSFQILILMITKPIPKLVKDNLLPPVMKRVKRLCSCCACIPFLKKFFTPDRKAKSEKTLLELELEKPTLGNFTLNEYTEKVILYGLMMLFAASFPLAPLLALLLNLIDIRLDCRRMLWVYQRPMAVIAEDIGTWYVILNFLNFCGVVSNAFLVAFTSAWGSKYSLSTQLWIVIGFEHICFSLKFLLAYLIPDVPSSVSLAMRKKRYHLNKKIAEDKQGGGGSKKTPRMKRKKLGPLRGGPHRVQDRDAPNQNSTMGKNNNFSNQDETDLRRIRRKKKDDDAPQDGSRRTRKMRRRRRHSDELSDNMDIQHYPYDYVV